MAIVIKTIRGRRYYYEQTSVYRPGRTPYSKMRYIGPVEPRRKSAARQLLMALGGPPEPIDWQEIFSPKRSPEDVAYALMEKWQQEKNIKAAVALISVIVEPLLSSPQQPSSGSDETQPVSSESGIDHPSDQPPEDGQASEGTQDSAGESDA